jgi:hypothetical protein
VKNPKGKINHLRCGHGCDGNYENKEIRWECVNRVHQALDRDR